MTNQTFGEILKNLRITNGIKSQRKLAIKSGISAATISRLESNIQKPEPDTLCSLALPLNKSYEELLLLAGYINTLDTNLNNLSLMEQELLLKSRKLSDTQLNLILNLIDEFIC